MELSNHETKPETRTIINFNDTELKEALLEYAQKRGYIFDCNTSDMFVWHPSDQHDSLTKFGIDKKGSEPGIRKGDPPC